MLFWLIVIGVILFLFTPIFTTLLKIILIKFILSVISFKQWLNKTVTKIEDNVYLLEHEINGELVKIIIEKRKINSVIDENYENCFLDEALPFLLYQQRPFDPTMIGLPKETKLLLNQKPIWSTETESE